MSARAAQVYAAAWRSFHDRNNSFWLFDGFNVVGHVAMAARLLFNGNNPRLISTDAAIGCY